MTGTTSSGNYVQTCGSPTGKFQLVFLMRQLTAQSGVEVVDSKEVAYKLPPYLQVKPSPISIIMYLILKPYRIKTKRLKDLSTITNYNYQKKAYGLMD